MRRSETSPAVVLQASGPNALGIVRSLGRAGVPVVACDADPRALGLLSRYARAVRTADPLTEPDAFVDGLAELGRTLPARGVLFATHDEALAAIGPQEDRLAAWFARPWSPWPTLERVLDKGVQQDAARRIGFPVPATVDPRDGADLAAVARELRFPVILKPRYAPEFRRRFRTQAFEAATLEELRAAWERAAPYAPLVSEVIPGGDELLWTLGSYRDADGRPLASFTGRKLRQWPPRFGTARSAESRWDPDLAARAHALLDALDYHGISQVEVKRDPRDGRDNLIEVNPRSWLWIGLATAAGVNVAHACYLDAIGAPRTWAPGHRDGLRWALLTKHLVASPRELARGQWGARAFLESIRPPLMDGVLDPRDPRPALAHLRRLARRG
ncbi:MAG: D-aspartate ligase [Miltoncostaeaceae bacterium]|nr:D-aspartate ligase [Miltoncostaeaceae bacterium]